MQWNYVTSTCIVAKLVRFPPQWSEKSDKLLCSFHCSLTKIIHFLLRMWTVDKAKERQCICLYIQSIVTGLLSWFDKIFSLKTFKRNWSTLCIHFEYSLRNNVNFPELLMPYSSAKQNSCLENYTKPKPTKIILLPT